MTKIKSLETDDPLFGKGHIRADGRKTHSMYIYQVKGRSESKGDYDFYKLISTIPEEKAFRPMSEGGCPIIK